MWDLVAPTPGFHPPGHSRHSVRFGPWISTPPPHCRGKQSVDMQTALSHVWDGVLPQSHSFPLKCGRWSVLVYSSPALNNETLAQEDSSTIFSLLGDLTHLLFPCLAAC